MAFFPLNKSCWIGFVAFILLATGGVGCTKKKKKENGQATDPAGSAAPCDQATDPLCNSKLQPTQQGKAALLPFESEAAYREYLAAAIKKNEGNSGKFGNGEQAASVPGESNENVTNTQEAGVDEGGIVKNIGDYLIVLRKGRLFALDVKGQGTPLQTDAVNVAPVKSLYEHVWYDEMLVLEKHVVVLGFRYVVPAAPGAISGSSPGPSSGAGSSQLTSGTTEVHTFALEGGKFSRGKSLYIESTDYYSATNFSTRLVGKSLFFYLPEQAVKISSGTPEPTIPRFLTFTDSPTGGAFSFGHQVLGYTDIHKPVEPPVNPTIHMLVTCDLATPLDPKCSARGILGDVSQHFYASKDRAYLWSYPWVYSLALDLQAAQAPKVFRVKGSGEPISYLGFKQTDSALIVIVKDIRNAKGSVIDEDFQHGIAPTADAPPPDAVSPDSIDPQTNQVEHVLNALTLPLLSFDGAGAQTLTDSNVTKIYTTGGILQPANPRAVGSNFVIPFATFETEAASTGNGSQKNDGQNFIAIFDMDSRASKVSEWSGIVSRVEAVGEKTALIVDSGDISTLNASNSSMRALRLTTIRVGMDVAPVGQVLLSGAAEGEGRSHSFFYKDEVAGNSLSGGLLGLAVINAGAEQSGWFGTGVSNLAFVAKDGDQKLKTAGVISSQGTFRETCESSCTDWYGNTRPIFLGNRIFALMGYELSEVAVVDGKVKRLSNAVVMK